MARTFVPCVSFYGMVGSSSSRLVFPFATIKETNFARRSTLAGSNADVISFGISFQQVRASVHWIVITFASSRHGRLRA